MVGKVCNLIVLLFVGLLLSVQSVSAQGVDIMMNTHHVLMSGMRHPLSPGTIGATTPKFNDRLSSLGLEAAVYFRLTDFNTNETSFGLQPYGAIVFPETLSGAQSQSAFDTDGDRYDYNHLVIGTQTYKYHEDPSISYRGGINALLRIGSYATEDSYAKYGLGIALGGEFMWYHHSGRANVPPQKFIRVAPTATVEFQYWYLILKAQGHLLTRPVGYETYDGFQKTADYFFMNLSIGTSFYLYDLGYFFY